MYSFLGMLLLPAMLLLASCSKETTDATEEANSITDVKSGSANHGMLGSELLEQVKEATSRFHSTNQAIRAGYVPTDHCVSNPVLGGMGYHWANTGLVDPVFNPLQPEVVLYATAPNGKLRLVAVEYIVIDVGQPRPMFDNQLFSVGGAPVSVPHWTLHVWLYENNPSGIFAPFNPNISCP